MLISFILLQGSWYWVNARENELTCTGLADALKAANLRQLAKTRADAHDLADTVEGIVAFSWGTGAVTIEKMIDILVTHLEGESLRQRDLRAETASAAEAFKYLLEEVVITIGLEE